MARRRRYIGYLFAIAGETMPAADQAAIWRAAAKGHKANGRMAESQSCLENARMIERTAGLRFSPKTNGRADQDG